ncbi:MAG: murein biosynthesis integral membrane protein MurJ [Alphaproteobacteria bacterium]|nr:murein biosynthesis integral membrane protein MurJ [Alphaproteobacteria bacterium]
MSLGKAIGTVGFYTGLSRVTGFLRDILAAQILGAGLVSDAFFVAFKFPNLFRRLFGEGAFNAAFVPLFSRELEGAGGKQGALAFAGRAFSGLALVLALFVGLFELIMPLAMYVFAPGFVENPEKFDLAVTLSRITFPYLLLISLVSLLSGILNAFHKFAAAAATPILLNLTLIASLLLLVEHMPTPGHAMAVGTSLAGLIQLAWVGMACRKMGFTFALTRPRLTPDIKRLLKRILPGAVGAGIYQMNLLVDIMLASLVAEGAVSYLYYADRVNQLPLGIVGAAIGTALLPILSRHLAAGNDQAAQSAQNRSLEFGLLIALPSAFGLMALALPITQVLFERGAFDYAASLATAKALAAFALGLPAFVLVKTLTPAFFAREDTATPVKTASIAMLANIAIAFALMPLWGFVGIALASAASAWLNVAMLYRLTRKHGWFKADQRLKFRLPRILLAAMATGLCAFGIGSLSDSAHVLGQALSLALAIGGAILVYASLLLLLKAASLKEFKRRGGVS